ncbi:DUF6152 family protein [Brucella sp. IR073]|uniref:DUF6152 family protein n=1 Tax=unclassified Brucella TaxID=2632610 RepID=UPI003B97E7CD
MKTGFVALLFSAFLAMSSQTAEAHHGWTYFDTSRVFYLEGEIISVRWGNPHPELVLRPTPRTELPDLSGIAMPGAESGFLRTMPPLPLPPGLQPLATDGAEYTVVLAPPSRLAEWGMTEGDAAPGRRLRLIGYLACDDDREFRPEIVILDNNRAIRQRSVPVPPTPCS